ncbi:MAG: alpha/beta hydrolase [Candidatus Sungbacteria bacterium]|nr:alpha/beta hydrolase [Candidatus Sungbacteria bacterium]
MKKLLYEDKPVVILHGWGSSARSFEEVRAMLVAKGFPVHAIDLPGFGDAEMPCEALSVSDYAQFVFQFAGRENLGPFYLLGHSLGGRIGIKFAVRHPDKLLGLILYAAAGIKPAPTLKTKLILLLAKMGKYVFSLPVLRYLKSIMTRALYMLAGTRDYYRARGVMKETMKKVIDEDLRPLLPPIRTKTLIVWGEKDRVTPLADAYVMAENIAGSELKIFKNTGHSLHKEQPEEFVDSVSSFLLS